jgi:type III pantothenate kinase
MKNNMLLADIGNTHFHIYDGKNVEHLSHGDAIEKYKGKHLYYISVKEEFSHSFSHIITWKDISSLLKIEGGYETMGIDRQALCLSYQNGIFVDAGSAITVDIVEKGEYKGGFILPGLKAYIRSYQEISPALDTHLYEALNLDQLPFTTKEQISYGIIASIKALIDKHSKTNTLYFTGGDGKFLSTFFEDVIYDETLVFQGMLKIIKDK